MFDVKHLFAPLAGIDLDNLELYVVGGAVRDTLLGLTPKDIDYVAVGASPNIFLELGFQQVGHDFPVFLHPKSHVEIALARTERKTQQGHTGFVVHADPTVSLETDLLRRDFTMNAMAISRGGELIDPYGGQYDLEQRIMRHVSHAFTEDPLRVLRGVRFLAQLGQFNFSLAPETISLMRSMSESLIELSFERIVVELDKTLKASAPAHGLSMLEKLRVLETLAPELKTIPMDFVSTSIDARFAEWVMQNAPTLKCVEHHAKRFRLTNRRIQLLKALIQIEQTPPNDPTSYLETMTKLGWLRGNTPDEVLDALLLEFDQTGLLKHSAVRWIALRERIRLIQASQFAQEGLSGKALGDAIYEARLRVLSTEISAPGTAPGL